MAHAAEFHGVVDRQPDGSWHGQLDIHYRHLDAAQLKVTETTFAAYHCSVHKQQQADGCYNVHASLLMLCKSSAELAAHERACAHLLQDLTLVPLLLAAHTLAQP